MSMESRALLPLLPSCFRRPAHVLSPEEACEIEKRRYVKKQKRLMAEARGRSGAPGPRRNSGHGDGATEAVVVSRYGKMSLKELLAYETEKREWIDEQKRLNAETRQRAGAPDPRWNDAADRRKGNTFSEEQALSAYDIKKRRWISEQKRLIAQARRRSVFDDRKRNNRRIHPLVAEEEVSAPAKPRCPPGGCNAPVRVTYAERFGPGSDAAFLKSIIAAGKSGGGGDSALQGDSDRWAEMDKAYSRRQRYLRYYCPFQKEEEEEEESVLEKTKPAEPDDAEIERMVPVRPANGPDSEAEFLKLVIKKNRGGGGGSGGNDVYYAMRREFLKSYHFTRD